MQKSSRKKKSEETYKIQRGAGGVNKAKAKIYLETVENDTHVFQNFRIVTSAHKFLQYFTDEKFLGFYILSDEMDKYYAGDGEKIFFRDKKYHNNLITVVYEKVSVNARFDPALENVQFDVEAPIPATLGCYDCIHFRKKNKKCMYYQIVGIDIRTNCKDFRQKNKE